MPRVLSFVVLLVAATAAAADKLVLVVSGEDTKLIQPFGVDFGPDGTTYIVEMAKGERLLSLTAKGELVTLAGTEGQMGSAGDGGPGLKATFNGMHSLAVTPDGTVYLADTWNHRIRTIDPKTGAITTFAGTGRKAYGGDGGPAKDAHFTGVFCIACNFDHSKLYVTDLDNRRIRAIDLKTGIVDLVAGNGQKGVPVNGSDAKTSPLVDPRACCVDRKGNVYILERSGHALRVVDPQGKIRTVAGTGKPGNTGDGGDARKATLNGPKHLCVDLDDNVIIADTANHVVRKYTPADGRIVRIAGTGKKGASGDGGDPLAVPFNEPHGVTVHRDGTLYLVDSFNHRVFRWEK